MKRQIALFGPALAPLLELSLLLDKHEYSVFVVEAKRPIERLLEGATSTDALIVYLSGDENVVDLQRALDASTGDVVIFLAPHFPMRAALARIMNKYGATVMRGDERPLFIIATLIALMTGRFGASA
jgi:hypothetical protein